MDAGDAFDFLYWTGIQATSRQILYYVVYNQETTI